MVVGLVGVHVRCSAVGGVDDCLDMISLFGANLGSRSRAPPARAADHAATTRGDMLVLYRVKHTYLEGHTTSTSLDHGTSEQAPVSPRSLIASDGSIGHP